MTMPAVPPYSSTTSAVCRPLARIWVITASPSRLDGTVATGSASATSRVRGPVGDRHGERLLDVHDADGLVQVAVDDREAGEAGLASALSTRSATVSSTCSASIFDRGVMSSSADRSPNCSERSTRSAVSASSEPLRLEVRTRETSSCGERADRSSSAGSMPSLRRIQLAVPLVTLIAGVRNRENHHCAGAAHRAVGSGLATARFLGTSSPKIIDTEVAISRANAERDAVDACAAGMPIAVSGAWSSVRDDRFGQVTGGQRRDRDAELGAGQLERQRAVRLLDVARRASRRSWRWPRRCCVPAR